MRHPNHHPNFGLLKNMLKNSFSKNCPSVMGLWGVLKKTRGADRACGVGEAFFWGCWAGRMLVISKYWQKMWEFSPAPRHRVLHCGACRPPIGLISSSYEFLYALDLPAAFRRHAVNISIDLR